MKTLTDVQAYIEKVGPASDARRIQAAGTATRALMRAHGVEDASQWTIEFLPDGAAKFGDCNMAWRRIRYRKGLLRSGNAEAIAATIVHEVAHAITGTELNRQGITNATGGHGTMWRGTCAALGLRAAQAHNLPAFQKADA